eukprot:TRINITY_DN29377_c0_g1_i2.p1 TRINITY_DN29377_c0_g1~~TRINITY_DN29377_c0_g1_i2.p1  ORF type:complete len:269 (+),score=89.27 TRINITY_DN29377_c0_g1_i2:173-979(+)
MVLELGQLEVMQQLEGELGAWMASMRGMVTRIQNDQHEVAAKVDTLVLANQRVLDHWETQPFAAELVPGWQKFQDTLSGLMAEHTRVGHDLCARLHPAVAACESRLADLASHRSQDVSLESNDMVWRAKMLSLGSQAEADAAMIELMHAEGLQSRSQLAEAQALLEQHKQEVQRVLTAGIALARHGSVHMMFRHKYSHLQGRARSCVSRWMERVAVAGEHRTQLHQMEELQSCVLVAVSYTHLRAHETPEHLVCRLLLEKKKQNKLKL